MGDEQLTKEQRKTLAWHKRMVDIYQSEAIRTNHHPNVQHDLFYARKALKEYTEKLRGMGVNI